MSYNILIIEDNPKHLFLIEDILDELDCQIDSATNNDEVVEKSKNLYDLVIVDIAVPGFNAEKFLVEFECKSKILVISAFADDENIDKSGYVTNQFIKKPFDPDNVLQQVKNILSINKQVP